MVLTRKEVGLQIKKARKIKSKKINQKYTQEMLASDLDISRGYIGDMESGRTYPNYVLLSKIAELCGVSVEFLTSDTGESDTDEINQPDQKQVNNDSTKAHIYDGLSEEELTEGELTAIKTYLALYRQQKTID